MLEQYFLRPTTVDRIRSNWLAPQIEQCVEWMPAQKHAGDNITRRIPLLHFADFARTNGATYLVSASSLVEQFGDHWIASNRCWNLETRPKLRRDAPISPIAVPDLPPEVQKVLDEFVLSAKEAFSDQVCSLVLFGSAAEGKLRPASDVNLLVVISTFEQSRADRLRQPLRVAESAVQLRPMFLLREEVAVASRVFAPKFADIIRRRVILFGDDPFASLSIPRDAEIRQLNQQSLNLTLRLRAAYVSRSLREEQLTRFIAGTLGPLRTLSAALLELESRSSMSTQAAFECLGAELKLPQWPYTLALLAAAHESRLLPAGSAAQVLFQLLEFLRGATLRVEALSTEVRRESV